MNEKLQNQQEIKDVLNFNVDQMRSSQDYELQFEKLADNLLNKQVLTINHSHKFRIAEIEFYYKQPLVHEDFIASTDNDLRENGKWYFLKYAN